VTAAVRARADPAAQRVHNLLVRAIRNYLKDRAPSASLQRGRRIVAARPVEEVLADFRRRDGGAAEGTLRRRGASPPVHEELVPAEAYQVSLFLGDGARRLSQDADPCAKSSQRSSRRSSAGSARQVPLGQRVTTYGRARTLARLAPEDLALLAGASLTRVHLGLESGADEVLMAVEKGCTGSDPRSPPARRCWAPTRKGSASTSCRGWAGALKLPRTSRAPPA
jgi:hypothetical protein